MTRGRVVLVAFPFDERTASKLRPAVCLTEPVGPFQHVTVAFVTSRLPVAALPTDLVIDADRVDFGATGLRATSVVRRHRLLTVGTDTVLRDIGRLSPALQDDVDRRLRSLFGL